MDYREGRRVLIVTLILNLIIALSKLVYGTFTGSASIAADGYHSFADGTNNIVGLVGFYIASRPIDKTHPYGHEKYETLTAMGIGAILLIFSFNILRDAVGRLAHPTTPQVTIISFAVMIITIGINIFVMLYEYREGKKIKSDFLVTDSYHTRGDILVSCSVIITLFGIKLGLPILDPIVSGLIALFIAFSAFEILWSTSRVLTDVAMIDPEKLRSVVTGIEEVKSCHNIRSRGRADNICVDLHIYVKPSMRTDESHRLAHEIEKKVIDQFPGVREVITHIEPQQ